MKKFKLTKVMAGALIAVSILALNPIGASAEWRQDNRGWWFAEGRNSWAVGWRQIDGKWYYFDNKGYMLHDTTTPDGYYVGSNGVWIQNNIPNNNVMNNGNLQNQQQQNQDQQPPQQQPKK